MNRTPNPSADLTDFDFGAAYREAVAQRRAATDGGAARTRRWPLLARTRCDRRSDWPIVWPAARPGVCVRALLPDAWVHVALRRPWTRPLTLEQRAHRCHVALAHRHPNAVAQLGTMDAVADDAQCRDLARPHQGRSVHPQELARGQALFERGQGGTVKQATPRQMQLDVVSSRSEPADVFHLDPFQRANRAHHQLLQRRRTAATPLRLALAQQGLNAGCIAAT